MKIVLKILKKINNKLYFFYQKYFKNHIRISSNPYVSGDTFRSHSDHILDEVSAIDPFSVKSGEILFVKTNFLNEFIEKCLPHLPDNIKLITHNSDVGIESNPFNEELSRKSIYWFAQNLKFNVINNQYIYPIPIGFENRNWLKNGKLSVLKNVKVSEEKINGMLCAFNTSTNRERIDILHYLDLNNHVKYLRRVKHKDYMKTLSEYKLSICPEGNGVDTHRIWESLLVETLPVVKKSNFVENLSSVGVPLFIIENWNELQNLDEEKINYIYSTRYLELKNKEYISNKYWLNKIKSSGSLS